MLQMCRNGLRIGKNRPVLGRRVVNSIHHELFVSTAGRPLCDSVINSEKNETFTNFNAMLAQRRAEATRSVLVQVSSPKSYSELHSYCADFGDVVGAHHYRIASDELNFILVEFKEPENVTALIESSCYSDDGPGVPVVSQFLWFRASASKKKLEQHTDKSTRLNTENGNQIDSLDDLVPVLESASSLDDQIAILHNASRLNDIGSRLRFLACRQIERSVAGMFPHAKAYPFGSSVNGFGKNGCDLDMILRFDDDQSQSGDRKKSRLVFHTKEIQSSGRSQTQRHMESIADILQLYLPGVCHVRRILQARVPIIKYRHDHLDLEVDLSMSNMTGVYMSELLYMFGELDSRVRPLVFAIRRWAQAVGLTNPSPGRWISNFSLTALVIYFLQQTRHPVLPPISALVSLALPQDVRVTEDAINCTFCRDLNRVHWSTSNGDAIGMLLLQFFEFYAAFDFHNRAISLNETRRQTKPDHSAIYIVNPLEPVLNVCKNVSLEECERFRIEVRNAAWLLESHETPKAADKNSNSWGLLSLFKSLQQSVIKPQMFFRPRMVDVSELFEESPASPIVYKNNSVRQEVDKIKQKGKQDLRTANIHFRTRRR